ncbi:MAG: hypothetical protein J7513_12330 [Solirubrobacteraceae bacterium]|nr:hypothetical protein [Solirubrobacteraceae bacterium]
MAIAARTTEPVQAQPESSAQHEDGLAAPVTLGVRVEPTGPSAERAIAVACAASPLGRDPEAPLGRPAATGDVEGGEAALAELVRVAALSLDETDLHLTVRRR